jgi:maltose alpha-D-glucosyltransferase/alpha-amylase
MSETSEPRRSALGVPGLPPLPRTGGPGEESRDPLWYQRAVFYEVLVRGFNDSNGDGTGDLRGLTERLDYLQWLGVDCLWLLPILESPLRDGGYDISDYFRILPEFGDLGDFVNLVDEAHRRGIRIVADLVMNHTSDEHPWFQASRTDPEGPFGDFYVRRAATTTSGPTPTRSTRTPASSSWTRRSRTGRGTRCAASTTGTASSPTSRT